MKTILYIVGPEGSGKSVLANNIKDTLTKNLEIDSLGISNYVYKTFVHHIEKNITVTQEEYKADVEAKLRTLSKNTNRHFFLIRLRDV